MRDPVVIVGAGPAGLTAAYLLTKHARPVVVLEADRRYVGGLARTEWHNGYAFDIGGHRFFSKSTEVEDFWKEILGTDLLERSRLSRICYNKSFFAYPIRPGETLRTLGPLEALRCISSYAKSRLFPIRHPRSVEEWVTNEFGSRLYSIFFKTYTEKVWGMKCSEISADWAAQRIKSMSLGKAISGAVRDALGIHAKDDVTSLVESFRYPKLGPGMLWEACRDAVVNAGSEVAMGHRVVAYERQADSRWKIVAETRSGETRTFVTDRVITSAPLSEIATTVHPSLPADVVAAAKSLRYRDFITVAVMAHDRTPLADNWLYIHDPNVRVGRIQVFKSWSPAMVPDPSMCCYGLEYFCFENDDLWASSDAGLESLARRELVELGLVRPEDVVDSCVVRQKKAYPVYDEGYAQRVALIRRALAEQCGGLDVVGRNGMHHYDNQDHAMMTAMLTARNIIAGEQLYDPWLVNNDAEYHESGASGQRLVPMAKSPA